MSVNNIDQIVNTDTFGVWKDRTNLIIEALQDVVSLGDSDAANANGDVVINGYVKAYDGIQTDTIDPVSGAGSTVAIGAAVATNGDLSVNNTAAGVATGINIQDNGATTWRFATNTSHTQIDIETADSAHVLRIDANTNLITAVGLTIDNDIIPNLDASKVTTGTFSNSLIPDLSASKITSDTFNAARIPDLEASKITPGTFNGDYSIANGSLSINNGDDGSPILTISDSSSVSESKVMMVIQGAGSPLQIINSNDSGDYEFVSGDTGIRINDMVLGFEVLHRSNADTKFDDSISSVSPALRVYTKSGLVTTEINTPTKFNGNITVDNAYTIRGPGSVPVGAIQGFMRRTAPVGWLVLNGSAIPNGVGTVQGIETDFTELYNLLVDIYGANGGNDINLPDMRGYFPRAYDSSPNSLTSDIGIPQEDQIASHTHGFTNFLADDGLGGNKPAFTNLDNQGDTNLVTDATGGDETRPKNIAFLYCIKY